MTSNHLLIILTGLMNELRELDDATRASSKSGFAWLVDSVAENLECDCGINVGACTWTVGHRATEYHSKVVRPIPKEGALIRWLSRRHSPSEFLTPVKAAFEAIRRLCDKAGAPFHV